MIKRWDISLTNNFSFEGIFISLTNIDKHFLRDQFMKKYKVMKNWINMWNLSIFLSCWTMITPPNQTTIPNFHLIAWCAFSDWEGGGSNSSTLKPDKTSARSSHTCTFSHYELSPTFLSSQFIIWRQEASQISHEGVGQQPQSLASNYCLPNSISFWFSIS